MHRLAALLAVALLLLPGSLGAAMAACLPESCPCGCPEDDAPALPTLERPCCCEADAPARDTELPAPERLIDSGSHLDAAAQAALPVEELQAPALRVAAIRAPAPRCRTGPRRLGVLYCVFLC